MIKSLFIGVNRASRNWKMIALLTISSIFFSLPLVIPIFLLVTTTTFQRSAADSMFADKADIDWITDLFNLQLSGASLEDIGLQLFIMVLGGGIAYLLLNTLFAGGILEVLTSEDGRFTMRKFWAGCGAYFWRYFRLMLISLVFYGGALILYSILQAIIYGIDKNAAAYEQVVYKQWTALGFLILLVALINMVFDYAKIGAAINERRSMIVETAKALLFTLRNIFVAFPLYLIITVIGIVIFYALSRWRWSIDQSTWGGVWFAILLGQVAIASRVWTKIAAYAAEVDLYRRLNPQTAPAPVFEHPEIVFTAATKSAAEEPVDQAVEEEKRTHENI